MREENWEETQENRKLENRDDWNFFCNSEPISLKCLKNDAAADDDDSSFQEKYIWICSMRNSNVLIPSLKKKSCYRMY